MLGWVPIVGRVMALQRCPCASLRTLWICCGKRDTAHASTLRIVTQGGYPKLSSNPTLVFRRWKQKAEEPEGDVVAEAEVRGVQFLALQMEKGPWAEECKRPLQARDSKESWVSPRPPQSNTALPRPWYQLSETQFRLLISRTVKSHLYCLKPLCGNLWQWQQTPIVSLPGYELPTHTTAPTHHGAASSLSITPAGLHAWHTCLVSVLSSEPRRAHGQFPEWVQFQKLGQRRNSGVWQRRNTKLGTGCCYFPACLPSYGQAPKHLYSRSLILKNGETGKNDKEFPHR